jgi:hypothetical protein
MLLVAASSLLWPKSFVRPPREAAAAVELGDAGAGAAELEAASAAAADDESQLISPSSSSSSSSPLATQSTASLSVPPSCSPLCVNRSKQTYRQQLLSPEFMLTLLLFVVACLVSNTFIGTA